MKKITARAAFVFGRGSCLVSPRLEGVGLAVPVLAGTSNITGRATSLAFKMSRNLLAAASNSCILRRSFPWNGVIGVTGLSVR